MEASIGYEASAAIAKDQIESGRDIRDIVRERNLLPEADLEEILKPRAMTEPGIAGQGRTRTPILGGGGGGGQARVLAASRSCRGPPAGGRCPREAEPE